MPESEWMLSNSELKARTSQYSEGFTRMELASMIGQEALIKWLEREIFEWDGSRLKLRGNSIDLEYKLMRQELSI